MLYVRSALALAAALTATAAGCGGDDFENRPRAPVPIELTGVIHTDKVTISPAKVGAGPISITIANETDDSHTVTLEGESVRERVPPVKPGDTATIQKTLAPGSYEVRAGSPVAVAKEIEPATLSIGRKRRDSNDRLLLP